MAEAQPAVFIGEDGHLYLRNERGEARRVPGEVDSDGNIAEPVETEQERSARAVETASGRRRALLIGINYTALDQGQLRGCINDVENMAEFLRTHFGYAADDITVLRDDDASRMPTKANIIAAIKKLVQGAQPGDSLFFHYSGHGSQTRDWTFLEEDGQNETICPCDYPTAGQIVDDDIHDLLCRPLPAGVQLVTVFDSCHSGSITDLPYVFVDTGSDKYSDAHKSSEGGFFSRHAHGWRAALTGTAGIVAVISSHVAREIGHQGAKYGRRAILRALNTTAADVYTLSGCRDEQTSADTAALSGEATGAMSYALIAAFQRNPQLSWVELMRSMRDILSESNRFKQVPQLSLGRESDTTATVKM